MAMSGNGSVIRWCKSIYNKLVSMDTSDTSELLTQIQTDVTSVKNSVNSLGGTAKDSESGGGDDTTNITRTGKGECRIHFYGTNHPTVKVDGITIGNYNNLFKTHDNNYMIPFNKSISLNGSGFFYFISYK